MRCLTSVRNNFTCQATVGGLPARRGRAAGGKDCGMNGIASGRRALGGCGNS
jgi:hypothetical protein